MGLRVLRFWFGLALMARVAGHILLSIWKRQIPRVEKVITRVWEVHVDLLNHDQHLAGNFLFWISVAREIPLYMAVRALHTKPRVETLHYTDYVDVRRKDLQIFWSWWRSGLLRCSILR